MAAPVSLRKRCLLQALWWWMQTWRYDAFQLDCEPAVVVLWHRDILPLLMVTANNDFVCPLSSSRDGQMLTHIIQKQQNIRYVFGSSNRRTVPMLRGLIRALAQGKNIFFAADGPRGPMFIAKQGPVFIANRADVPIVLLCAKFTGGLRFSKMWDATIIPWPWSKISFAAQRFVLPADVKKEQIPLYSQQLSEQLNAVNRCNGRDTWKR